MKYITALAFGLLGALCPAQNDDRRTLIVVHVEPGSGNKFRQQIMAYHFSNGNFTGRDEIMTVTGKQDGKDYIRTDLGANIIYKDRYLITGIGNIIDLDNKKVLFDGRAGLLRCERDSAVFYTNDIFKGKFYSVYNFKTQQYGEVKDLLFKGMPGQDVEFDKTASPFTLYYYPPGKPKVLLANDAGYGQRGTGSDHAPDPPLVWISQNEFVFGALNAANTELAVYKGRADQGQPKLLGKVAVSAEKKPAAISKVDDKTLLLCLGDRQILIDLKAGTVTTQDFSLASYGFSYACAESAQGRGVKLNGKDLGAYHFKPVTFCANKNIACFVKEISVGDESYQQGLSVWNAGAAKWSNVEAEEVLAIGGWLNH